MRDPGGTVISVARGGALSKMRALVCRGRADANNSTLVETPWRGRIPSTPGHWTSARRTLNGASKFVGLERSDLARIATIKDLVTRKADDFTEVFFDRLRSIPEAAPLFARADVLGEAKRLKRDHLIAMVGGAYDKAYVDQRVALGMLYGKVGLDVRVFLGAFHHLMRAGRDGGDAGGRRSRRRVRKLHVGEEGRFLRHRRHRRRDDRRARAHHQSAAAGDQ
jgi:hypothetical protein